MQVISQWVVLLAEETSSYSWSRFCTVNSGEQLKTFPREVRGLNRRLQRWEASVLQLISSVQASRLSVTPPHGGYSEQYAGNTSYGHTCVNIPHF